MRLLIMPILALRLGWSMAVFFAQVIWSQLGWSLASILTIILTIWLIFSTLWQDNFQKKFLQNWLSWQTKTQKTQELLFWQEQLKRQPLHRDILVRSAELSCDLELMEQCQEYARLAIWLDPNHESVLRLKKEILTD